MTAVMDHRTEDVVVAVVFFWGWGVGGGLADMDRRTVVVVYGRQGWYDCLLQTDRDGMTVVVGGQGWYDCLLQTDRDGMTVCYRQTGMV